MGNNKEAKRDALRSRLIEAGESELAEHGLSGLKARNVTAKAGCALGALYNAVSDLDGLVILINSRTLARLGNQLTQAVPNDAQPDAAIQSLALAYVDFALAEPNLWFAAFNHRLPDGQTLPDWHQQEFIALFSEIAAPLSQLLPDLSADALGRRAQTLFAAVNGVVQLSLNGQFAGSPKEYLADEVETLVSSLTRGMR